MNCKKCGFKLEETWAYCPQCNTPVRSDNKRTIYIGLSLFFVALCIALCIIHAFVFSGFSFIAAVVVIITAKISRPKDTFISVLFWLLMGFGALLIVLFAIAMISCGFFVGQACGDCYSSMKHCG